MLLSSLLLACSLTVPAPVIVQVDTVPAQYAPALPANDERQAQQVFRNHYKPKSYPAFAGHITWIGIGTYRLDSFTMRIDTAYAGMTCLLSRGLLHPDVGMIALSSSDTLSIGNLYELKTIPSMPQVRRFSCWVFDSRIANPIWYVFELTSGKATRDTNIAAFLQDARLTFFYQVSIII
jgi:hypothetical protein